MVAPALAAIGAEPVGGAPVALGSHADRPVTRWRTSRGDVVVKVFPRRETAVAVHTAATSLWQSTFGARRDPPGLPEPVALLPGCAAVATRYVAGDVLPDDDPGALRSDLPDVALLLADLHASDCVLQHRRSRRAMVRSVHRKAADLDGPPIGPAALRVAELLQRVATDCPAPARSFVPTHGDVAAHNVLAAAAGAGRPAGVVGDPRAARGGLWRAAEPAGAAHARPVPRLRPGAHRARLEPLPGEPRPCVAAAGRGRKVPARTGVIGPPSSFRTDPRRHNVQWQDVADTTEPRGRAFPDPTVSSRRQGAHRHPRGRRVRSGVRNGPASIVRQTAAYSACTDPGSGSAAEVTRPR
jgi:hypothetical protein